MNRHMEVLCVEVNCHVEVLCMLVNGHIGITVWDVE